MLSAAPFSPWKVPQVVVKTNFSLGSTVGTPAMAKAIATPVKALAVLWLSRSTRPLSAVTSAVEARLVFNDYWQDVWSRKHYDRRLSYRCGRSQGRAIQPVYFLAANWPSMISLKNFLFLHTVNASRIHEENRGTHSIHKLVACLLRTR